MRVEEQRRREADSGRESSGGADRPEAGTGPGREAEPQGSEDRREAGKEERSETSAGEEMGQRRDEGETGQGPDTGEGDGADVAAEMERLREEVESWRGRALRMQADFENFRRRTRQEREEWAASATMGVIERLLPVLDHLELALQSGQQSTDVQSLLQGVEMVVRQFREILEGEGVRTIETVGMPFDPNVHEAVAQVPDSGKPPGTIIEEFRKGYRYKDRVLRPAMVKVSGDTGGN
ncbi:nucleotide exchange factor for DnaK activity [Kyrpidia spormannii]|uniref:Nucleotide exchange factor for DnaK activity n=1 Tax=Kyrpidia spormannii TaxID=2055160 RepID=A0ACA8ZBG0_9BACL|nr:nucleotide exchange factor for DnaK activity [Kyrpidia spormannii]